MNKIGNVIINLIDELSDISTSGEVEIRLNSEVSDPEEFQRLFKYFTKGTYLEHIDLKVNTFQPKIECGCGYTSRVDSLEQGYAKCPKCGKFAELNDHSYEIQHPAPNGVRKGDFSSF